MHTSRLIIVSFLLLAFPMVAQWAGENQVLNGTFDDGLTNWVAQGTPATREVVGSFSGHTNVLHVVADANGEGSRQNDIAIVADDSIRLQFDYYVVSQSLRWTVTDQVNAALTGFDGSVTTTGSWQTFTYFGVAAEGVESIKLWFRSNLAAEYYIDNVSIVVYQQQQQQSPYLGLFRYFRW